MKKAIAVGKTYRIPILVGFRDFESQYLNDFAVSDHSGSEKMTILKVSDTSESEKMTILEVSDASEGRK